MGDTAMTAEVPRGPGGPLPPQTITEARSLIAPGSVLSRVVETQVLQEGRFKNEANVETVEIKFFDEYLAILKRIDGGYELTLFNEKKGRQDVPLDPRTADVSRILTEGSGPRWTKGRPDCTFATARDPQVIFKMLQFSQDTAQRMERDWYNKVQRNNCRLDSDGSVNNNLVSSFPPFYINVGDWKLEIKEDAQSNKVLVATVGDSHFVINPNTLQRSRLGETTYLELNNPLVKIGDNFIMEGEMVFGIYDANGRKLASFSGSDPVVDPINPSEVYFINAGRVYSLDTAGVANKTSIPTPEGQITIQDPQELAMDPNGNFIIVRSSDNKLHIVDKESGEDIRQFENVKGFLHVDPQGGILFVDTHNKLREIRTNFQAIPPGGDEKARQRREEELKQMQERFANLELGKVQRQQGAGISEADVAQTLRESISRQVTDPLTKATKPEEVEDILDRLQALKGDPSNQAYTEVIDEFVNQARDRLSGIRTVELNTQFSGFEKALADVKSVGDTIGLDEQFAKILELRQRIDITDPQIRREVEQRLHNLQARKDTLNNQYQGELVAAARETLPQIEQLIKETGSQQELIFFGQSVQVQQFEMMLSNIRDPQVRRELRDQYTAIRSAQREALEASSNELAERDRQRWAQVVEEAREDLVSLQEQIEQLSDAREIDRFGRNPLVTAWRAKLFALPPELREIEEKRLEIILGARKKDMEHRRELGAVGEAGELKFGNTSFPIYKEPPRIWQPKFVPIPGGLSAWADLVFEDSQGRVWKHDPEHRTVVVADMNDERTKSIVERYRKEADEYFRGIKRKVPEFDEHWRITTYHMKKLEEAAEALNLQLVNHRGILLLQGEAGTGKNVLIDMLANLSNREAITVQCNENTVKEDLAYEFDWDPAKGTVKWPSRLLEGLQTPGEIIFFDEINALKPGIAKMMNSLFDYRRRLSFTTGGVPKEIIADPTVLFIGAMNPQNYAGVNRLSPEVKSRARVIDIDYPPFEEARGGRTYWRSDEAEMLAGYMDDLSELKQPEFKLVWDYVINRDTTNGADRILQGNPQIEVDVRRIYDVIRVANALRDAYEAYQIGDAIEPMDFPTSLREVTDIVMEMNHRQGVKPMIKRVIIPKIDDRRQKRLVEQTIDAVLPNP